MQTNSIHIAYKDSSAGYEVSPERVRLHDLAEFTKDVEKFLGGNGKEVNTKDIEVAIVHGSVALKTQKFYIADRLLSDLNSLLMSAILDPLEAARTEVITKWQKRASLNKAISFVIQSPAINAPIEISANTDFRTNDADQWVAVEQYIRGEIEDLGGSTRANAHIRLPNGDLLKVHTDRVTLRDDRINRLYKKSMLRVKAEYNVVTKEYRDVKLIEFFDYQPEYNEEEIIKLTRRGNEAWKDVVNASQWVDELRGDSFHE